jgi:hypothetical protein
MKWLFSIGAAVRLQCAARHFARYFFVVAAAAAVPRAVGEQVCGRESSAV